MSSWSRLPHRARCAPISRSRCRRADRLPHPGPRAPLRRHLRRCGLEAVHDRIRESLVRGGHIPDAATVHRLEEFARLLDDDITTG